jgi:YHS domain-containing protein
MKGLLISLSIVVLGGFLLSCSKEQKTETTPTEEQATVESAVTVAQLAVNVDPACGMALTDENLHDTMEHQDNLYGFCSADCKHRFMQDPDMYVAKLEEEREEGHDEEGHKN